MDREKLIYLLSEENMTKEKKHVLVNEFLYEHRCGKCFMMEKRSGVCRPYPAPRNVCPIIGEDFDILTEFHDEIAEKMETLIALREYARTLENRLDEIYRMKDVI